MADFLTCIDFVIKHETYKGHDGKLVTIYRDSETGEYSNYGISQKFLRLISYSQTDPTKLTYQEILDLYQNYFWKPYWLGTINSNLVAQKILDMVVNMGPFNAIMCVQTALNSIGFPCVNDGRMGPHTLLVISQCMILPSNELRLLQELALKADAYYKRIAVGLPNGLKDLPVWLARAGDIGINQEKLPVT